MKNDIVTNLAKALYAYDFDYTGNTFETLKKNEQDYWIECAEDLKVSIERYGLKLERAFDEG